MVEDEDRLGVGGDIARFLLAEGDVTVWTMPGHLVGRDDKGRLILTGDPKSNYDLAEQIARVLGREIIWATVGDNLKYNGAYARSNGPTGQVIGK